MILRSLLLLIILHEIEGSCKRSIEETRSFGRYSTVSNITITCNNVNISSGEFKNYGYGFCSVCTRILKINNASIFSIQPQAFSGFSESNILFLDEVNIETILPGAFNSLHRLEKLFLRKNKLKVISTGVFNSLNSLEVLDLSENILNELHKHTFSGSSNLRKLNLSHNELASSTDYVYESFEKLITLDLSFNQLKSFKEKLNSSNLILSNNRLEQVNFVDNRNLLVIDVSHNLIKKLNDDSFRGLSSLKKLYVEYNRLKTIPHGCFSDLFSLQTLNLSHNELEKLQYGLFDHLTSLRILDLSSNKLSAFNKHNFHSLKALYVLNLENNRLVHLNAETLLNFSPGLTFVYLDNNRFSCEELIDVIHAIKTANGVITTGSTFNFTNVFENYCTEKETAAAEEESSGRDYNSRLLEGVMALLVVLIFLIVCYFVFKYIKRKKGYRSGEHFELIQK